MTTDIIFLDFDGVTHPLEFKPGASEQSYFCFLPTILATIAACAPHAAIVVSSAWRNWDDFNKIVPDQLLKRIVGVTPTITLHYDGVREDEALEWIRRHVPAHRPVRWMAIDDTKWIWRSHEKVLLCTDGFRKAEQSLMIAQIEQFFNAAPVKATGLIV